MATKKKVKLTREQAEDIESHIGDTLEGCSLENLKSDLRAIGCPKKLVDAIAARVDSIAQELQEVRDGFLLDRGTVEGIVASLASLDKMLDKNFTVPATRGKKHHWYVW